MKKGLIIGVSMIMTLLVVTSVSAKKEDNNGDNDKSEEKQTKQVVKKAEKVQSPRDYEKPTVTKSNASLHAAKSKEVVSALDEAVTSNGKKKEEVSSRGEKVTKKESVPQERGEDISDEELDAEKEGEGKTRKVIRNITREKTIEGLAEISNDIEEIEGETTKAIENAEKQNKFKKLLIGTDYKNLGQLRSSLVQNRNQIRKLVTLSEGTIDEEMAELAKEQLVVLTQERERIKAVISENETGFSFLGWAFRLINGYPKESINEDTEQELKEEVELVVGMEEAISNDDSDDEVGDTDNEEVNGI